MAIEIRELNIRLNIEEKPKVADVRNNSLSKLEKHQLVKECVDKVLEKLENKSDR